MTIESSYLFFCLAHFLSLSAMEEELNFKNKLNNVQALKSKQARIKAIERQLKRLAEQEKNLNAPIEGNALASVKKTSRINKTKSSQLTSSLEEMKELILASGCLELKSRKCECGEEFEPPWNSWVYL